MALNDPELLTRVRRFVATTSDVTFANIRISPAIKVRFHTFLRMGRSSGSIWQPRTLYVLRLLAVQVYYITKSVLSRFHKHQLASEARSFGKDKLLVISDSSGHVAHYLIELLQAFDKSEIIVIETSRRSNESVVSTFPNHLRIHELLSDFTASTIIHLVRRWLDITREFDGCSLPEKIFLFSEIGLTIRAFGVLDRLLETLQPSAVLTLTGTHRSDYAALQLALRRNIKTYVCQHGDPSVLDDILPIPSDIFFVWGEKSVQRYTTGGVPREKMIIAGNPKFDAVFSQYFVDRARSRAALELQLKLNSNRRNVTFFSSGTSSGDLSRTESDRLMEVFFSSTELDVNLILKLHPTADDKSYFEKWLKGRGLEDRVQLLMDEDIRDVLAVTDCAVVHYTSVGIEALCFGIPTIVLNVIEGQDVTEAITFAKDTFECTNQQSYRETLHQLLNDDKFYQQEVVRIHEARKRYFPNSETFNTSEFVRDFVQAEMKQRPLKV